MNKIKFTRWTCPECNITNEEQINLYNENLRVQNFKILPIYPTCKICGSKISFNANKLNDNGIKVIILTGTCASGKSTTAEMLMQKYGFQVIDGDCVIKVVKHKFGINNVEYNSIEVLNEIANQIDMLASMGKDIVLSHVILPEDIHKYRKIFQERNLNYKFFLLQPSYESAVLRSKGRTCFDSITDEKWIKYFYDEVSVFKKEFNDDLVILDNSNQTVEESTNIIIKSFNTLIHKQN